MARIATDKTSKVKGAAPVRDEASSKRKQSTSTVYPRKLARSSPRPFKTPLPRLQAQRGRITTEHVTKSTSSRYRYSASSKLGQSTSAASKHNRGSKLGAPAFLQRTRSRSSSSSESDESEAGSDGKSGSSEDEDEDEGEGEEVNGKGVGFNGATVDYTDASVGEAALRDLKAGPLFTKHRYDAEQIHSDFERCVGQSKELFYALGGEMTDALSLQVQDMKDASSEAARHYTAARVEFVEGMAQIEKLFHEKITRMETLAAKLITLRLSCAKDLDSSRATMQTELQSLSVKFDADCELLQNELVQASAKKAKAGSKGGSKR